MLRLFNRLVCNLNNILLLICCNPNRQMVNLLYFTNYVSIHQDEHSIICHIIICIDHRWGNNQSKLEFETEYLIILDFDSSIRCFLETISVLKSTPNFHITIFLFLKGRQMYRKIWCKYDMIIAYISHNFSKNPTKLKVF